MATESGRIVSLVIHSGKTDPRGLDLRRFALPHYLKDETLPLEVWEAIWARDIAFLSFVALDYGAYLGAPSALLAEYAEIHRAEQWKWLDLLVWLFELPPSEVIPDSARIDWNKVLEETAKAAKGLELLWKLAEAHPEGFSLKPKLKPSE